MFEQPAQGQFHRTALHRTDLFSRPPDQDLGPPGIHPQPIGIHRDQVAAADGPGSLEGAHQGRDLEFPGHGGQMAGDRPLIRQHGRGPAQQGRPLR